MQYLIDTEPSKHQEVNLIHKHCVDELLHPPLPVDAIALLHAELQDKIQIQSSHCIRHIESNSDFIEDIVC